MMLGAGQSEGLERCVVDKSMKEVLSLPELKESSRFPHT